MTTKTKGQSKKLPQNTEITTYFLFKNIIFSSKKLPDGRRLAQIEHTWGDGELMEFGYDFGEGAMSGINPLHIVAIYDHKVSSSTIRRHLNKFLKTYYSWGDVETNEEI